MTPFYTIQQADNDAEIYIFGDIADEQWTEGDMSPPAIVREIKKLSASVIRVYVNSYGGSVAAGWAIYNALKRHPAKIITCGTGFVCSAALYPFMSGDERLACNPSAYFFHNVLGGGFGYADDLRKQADDLDRLTRIGVGAFTDNTPLSAEEVRALMDAETWLSPQEALEKGIATAVLSASDAPVAAPAQSVRDALFQRVLAAPNRPPDRQSVAERLRKMFKEASQS